MIGNIVKLLQTDDFYGISKEIEIAKGKYQLIKSVKIAKRQIIRGRMMKKTERNG
jgi:hypothetical protein